ncbi:MAG: type II toxin-antitoxin system VapC family toxin [bacterium]|nr:MAG: type II toxin-antitoxin system VapC family toxin [bacterium]
MIFIDSGAWIALTDRKNQYHKKATLIYSKLKERRELLATTDYIIDETVTCLRYDLGHAAAVRFLDLIEKTEQTGVLRIFKTDNFIFKKEEFLFRQYDSVVFSFTDCTSFVVCQKHKISEAFAFDQHFLMMGISLYS